MIGVVRRKILLVAFTVFGAALTVPAHAGLIGDTITATWLFPDSGTIFATDSLLVGAGVEIDCPPGGPATSTLCAGFASAPASIDIGDNNIRYDQTNSPGFSPASFNGYLFSGLDFGPGTVLSGFTLNTDIAGLLPGAVSFTADSISINLAGLGAGESVYFELTLETARVPEPATVLLLGSGLLGGALARRRAARRRS